MKQKPIEILCKDDKAFEQIALLIDRDDFLDDLVKFRKRNGISKLYTLAHYHKRQAICNKLFAEEKKLYFNSFRSGIYDDKEFKKNFSNIINYAISKSELDFLSEFEDKYKNDEFKNNIKKLIRKYVGYDLYKYYPVIYYVGLYGVAIGEEMFPSWYIEYGDGRNKDYITRFGYTDPYIKVCVSNKISKSEFIDIYDQIRGNLTKQPDTIKNIRRDREWYWLHKNGVSYAQILKQTKDKISKQGIIEAIKQYSKRLNIKV